MQVVYEVSFYVIASTVHEKRVSSNALEIALDFLLHAFTLLPPKDN